MTSKDRRKKEKSGFYSRALDEAEKLAVEEACGIEGLDEEIAVLRVRLRQLIQQHPEKFELQLKVAAAITRMVGMRYNIGREQKKSLREAITRVITDIAVPLGVKILFK